MTTAGTTEASNIRPLEDGIERDLQGLNYGSYLHLDELLHAQQPVSDHHDEMLFIVVHHVTELWIKLVIHEIRSAISLLAADELGPALKRLARVKHVQRQMIEQWAVLATLTPSEYAQFRGLLGKSSGFQSAQYRTLEFLLGNKNRAMIAVFAHDPETAAQLERDLHAPSLYDEFLLYLARRGYPIPAALLTRDFAEPHTRDEDLVRIFTARVRRPGAPVGRVRDVRGTRRHRGHLPDLAVPAPEDRRAHHRLQARHRRVVRRRLPVPRAVAHLLPRAVRRPHRDRRADQGSRMTAPTLTIARAHAEALDRTDPLAAFRDRYLPTTDEVVAYLDGNSLGRPLARTKVILDRDNFPTNRYVAESLARDLDLELVWLEPPADGGVTPEAVAAVVDDRTAVVTLSHIAYQSAYLADAPSFTEVWDALELIRTLSATPSD